MKGSIQRIAVTGWGAVSPAGWGVGAMMDALHGDALPISREWRDAERRTEITLRRVPSPDSPPEWFRHPRLRRCSPVTRFLTGAAFEALGRARAESFRKGEFRLGVIATMLAGCVQYSRRFYAEILANPATASPILFPETVFNAPASHLGALLGATGMNYTLIGDGAEFLGGLELATEWLRDGEADGVLVVAGEECDWLSAEAHGLFVPGGILAEGGGALFLEPSETGIELALVTDPYRSHGSAGAIRCVLEEIPSAGAGHLIIEGEHGPISPMAKIGDALAVTPAWQCVAACASLSGDAFARASVVAAGLNLHCRGATFEKFPSK